MGAPEAAVDAAKGFEPLLHVGVVRLAVKSQRRVLSKEQSC